MLRYVFTGVISHHIARLESTPKPIRPWKTRSLPSRLAAAPIRGQTSTAAICVTVDFTAVTSDACFRSPPHAW